MPVWGIPQNQKIGNVELFPHSAVPGNWYPYLTASDRHGRAYEWIQFFPIIRPGISILGPMHFWEVPPWVGVPWLLADQATERIDVCY